MNDFPQSRELVVRLFLDCLGGGECSAIFEPHGAEMVLREGDHFRVEISGPDSAEISIGYSPGAVTVWEPKNSHMKVWNEAGEQLL